MTAAAIRFVIPGAEKAGTPPRGRGRLRTLTGIPAPAALSERS